MSWFTNTTGTTAAMPTVTYTPATTTTTTTGLGQDYAKILGQLQGYQWPKEALGPGYPQLQLPSREKLAERVGQLEKQLELLKEVDALLEKHPDLERLVGTLHRLGSL